MQTTTLINARMNYIASYVGYVIKVAVRGYCAGKAWLCICVGVEPPFSKSWIRHCCMMLHGTVILCEVIKRVSVFLKILKFK